MNSNHFHQINHSLPFVERTEHSSRETIETTMMESALPLDMREFWNIVDEDYFSIPSKLAFDKVNHFVSSSKGKCHIYTPTYRNRLNVLQSQAFKS